MFQTDTTSIKSACVKITHRKDVDDFERYTYTSFKTIFYDSRIAVLQDEKHDDYANQPIFQH